jgi:hypothetical protein
VLVAATAITLAAASLAGRARRRAHCAQRLVRALSPLILGMPLQAWQWALLLWKHNSTVQADLTPWPLYCWSALLAWCTWRVALLIRRLEITRTTMWAVVLGACALALGVNGFVQYKLWDALSFGYHDIGLFARALHNAAEGRGLYVDSLGYVTLAEHADFLLWALVPACMVGASPFHLLVFTSAACFAVPAIIVAWYLRRCLGSNFAGLLGALAWLFLPSHGCLVLARGYGFHPVYLAVPLLVAGRSLSSVRRWGAATACTLIACLAREEVSLTVPAWGGLYVAVVDKRRLLGLGVAAACAAYFYRTVFVVIPLVRGKAYPWIAAHYRVEAAAGGGTAGHGRGVCCHLAASDGDRGGEAILAVAPRSAGAGGDDPHDECRVAQPVGSLLHACNSGAVYGRYPGVATTGGTAASGPGLGIRWREGTDTSRPGHAGFLDAARRRLLGAGPLSPRAVGAACRCWACRCPQTESGLVPPRFRVFRAGVSGYRAADEQPTSPDVSARTGPRSQRY